MGNPLLHVSLGCPPQSSWCKLSPPPFPPPVPPAVPIDASRCVDTRLRLDFSCALVSLQSRCSLITGTTPPLCLSPDADQQPTCHPCEGFPLLYSQGVTEGRGEVWARVGGASGSLGQPTMAGAASSQVVLRKGHALDGCPVPTLAAFVAEVVSLLGGTPALLRSWRITGGGAGDSGAPSGGHGATGSGGNSVGPGLPVEPSGRDQCVRSSAGPQAPPELRALKVALSFGGSNRFCGRVGRQHKSNHTVWHVDPRVGVLYQTCYDVDCTGFRSEPTTLPRRVLAATWAELGSHGFPVPSTVPVPLEGLGAGGTPT